MDVLDGDGSRFLRVAATDGLEAESASRPTLSSSVCIVSYSFVSYFDISSVLISAFVL